MMEDIVSHKVLLDQLISVCHELQPNDSSVSSVAARITGRFNSVETQAKVLWNSLILVLISADSCSMQTVLY